MEAEYLDRSRLWGVSEAGCTDGTSRHRSSRRREACSARHIAFPQVVGGLLSWIAGRRYKLVNLRPLSAVRQTSRREAVYPTS